MMEKKPRGKNEVNEKYMEYLETNNVAWLCGFGVAVIVLFTLLTILGELI